MINVELHADGFGLELFESKFLLTDEQAESLSLALRGAIKSRAKVGKIRSIRKTWRRLRKFFPKLEFRLFWFYDPDEAVAAEDIEIRISCNPKGRDENFCNSLIEWKKTKWPEDEEWAYVALNGLYLYD